MGGEGGRGKGWVERVGGRGKWKGQKKAEGVKGRWKPQGKKGRMYHQHIHSPTFAPLRPPSIKNWGEAKEDIYLSWLRLASTQAVRGRDEGTDGVSLGGYLYIYLLTYLLCLFVCDSGDLV